MHTQTLNGVWRLQEAAGHKPQQDKAGSIKLPVLTQEGFPVQVPGTVLSCLLAQDAIDDPYYRDNEYAVRDLFWKDYSFCRTFVPDQELLSEEMVELVCHSLDTLAEVYLNGTLLGRTDNMHRTWRFSVRDYLKEGDNQIKIIFRSALHYAGEYQCADNKTVYYEAPCTTKGNEFIRKAHSMFGWDWGAQLIDAGIQRDIELTGFTQAKLEDVRIKQEHREGTVEVTVTGAVAQCKENALPRLLVALVHPDGHTENRSVQAVLPPEPGRQEMIRLSDGRLVPKLIAKAAYQIEEPQLWWPNGFGEHPLYTVKVTLESGNDCPQAREYRIGLRTLTVSRDKDVWGSEFAFCVNGIKIFTMGANYIPQDCVYPRISREKIRTLIDASVRANYNCLRVWGGGCYPSDYFYDLCDEKGLIVWQDLMFACNIYELTDAFAENIAQEARENVRRLRHHACLGLWCGNNELETAWVNWTDFEGHSEYLRADYIRQFEEILPRAVKEEDDTTFYWPSSPSSGGCFDEPNAENRGDVHYWEVWHGQKPFTDYRNYYFRFCSEFGFQSFPGIKTVRSFTEPQDRNIFSDVMESHQKNSSANGKILYYLSENFRYPKDFGSLLYVSQILQAIAVKYGVEHWRRNRGRCMGALYWQLNDEWPVASWAGIDYYGRWKALHYYARHFYEPAAGSLIREDGRIDIWLENETPKEVGCEVEIALRRMDFTTIKCVTVNAKAAGLSACCIGSVDFSQELKEISGKEIYVSADFSFEDGRVQREVETFVPYKHVRLEPANLTAEAAETADAYEISISADRMAAFVELDLTEADGLFSDNYFMLTDASAAVITLKKADIFCGIVKDAADLKRQLTVRSLYDSYDIG